MTLPRIICRFSCGVASAVATKLTLAKYARERITITYCDPGSEHPDNARFLADCVRWFNHPIITLKSEKYADTWAVWEGEKFITSKDGAPCTGILKREPTYATALPDDVLVFGYTAEETKRAKRFQVQNFEQACEFPLIEAGLDKSDCRAMVDRAGIVLPAMYLLGFHNNNCVGCCKAGMGYWNRIRVFFPLVFAKMAALQRKLGPGSALWREDDGTPILLDDLDPKRGNHDTEPKTECSLLCHIAEQNLEAAE